MPPERRRATTTDTRAARWYAEQLYQSLMRWHVQESDPICFDRGPARTSGFSMPTLGNWASAGSSASWGTEQLLTLPWGSVPERNFGLVMLDLLNSGDSDLILYGKLLARIQTKVSPATLVDERGGWRFPREKSIRYALAVLTFGECQGQRECCAYYAELWTQLQKSQD
ncbi:hypothetical protein Q0M94_03515 [Deinococcus radiomollis]|uniref:hypothetical protein n=1 Tax=Deinococcus radiomollis TaxID=468916 RepID=UPI003892C40A